MSGPKRRPRVSNSPVRIIRGIESVKVFYWTDSRLKSIILPYINARESHFGRAFDRIQKLLANGKTIEGKHHDPLVLLREYGRRAPDESEIDRDRLLDVFDRLDPRAAERLGAILIAERERLDLARGRIPAVSEKKPFEIKQYPAKSARGWRDLRRIFR